MFVDETIRYLSLKVKGSSILPEEYATRKRGGCACDQNVDDRLLAVRFKVF